MISRQWRGIAKPGMADAYKQHLRTDTFPKLREMDGFLKASILYRQHEKGTEFLIVTEWRSMEAIEAFTGSNVTTAVIPPVVDAMMVEYDSSAVHYTQET